MIRRSRSSSYLRGEPSSSRHGRGESPSPSRSVSSSEASVDSSLSPRRRPSYNRSNSQRSVGSADDSLTGYVIGDATSNKSLRSLRSGGSDHRRRSSGTASRPRSLSRPRNTYPLRNAASRRKHPAKPRRMSLYLSVYILLVFVYLFVTLRRLRSSDVSRSAPRHPFLSSGGPSSSLSLARVRDWISSRRRNKGPTKEDRLSDALRFPPPYPRITRTDDVGLSDEALRMCTRTLWHTVETTTIVLPDRETFVHTGDIDDLWLRDSAAQVHPLLVPVLDGGTKALVQVDERLDRIVSGLVKRTGAYIRHDPYANAFRIDDTYVFSEEQKKLGRHDLISTWNYELDSACYFMRLLYFYWKQSPHGNERDSVVRLKSVQDAVEIMVDLWIAEQRHEDDAYPVGRLFDCLNCNKPYRYPGLPRDGKGSATNASSGMTWSGFRPSDDECQYGFLVPANMFAVVALQYMAEMAQVVWKNDALAGKARRLALEIDQGIRDHAIVHHPEFGRIYAYEVDGLGNALLMDDANIPNLLSIPYLGYEYDPEVYNNSRRFIFSAANPEYRKGANSMTGEIEGFGSPHMAAQIPNNIWPMSIAMRGLTSDSVEEKVRLVEQLVRASAGTLWMHESFDANNPSRYTRSWFCWSDSLFAELVMSITDACPDPNYKYHVLDWRDPENVVGGEFAVE